MPRGRSAAAAEDEPKRRSYSKAAPKKEKPATLISEPQKAPSARGKKAALLAEQAASANNFVSAALPAKTRKSRNPSAKKTAKNRAAAAEANNANAKTAGNKALNKMIQNSISNGQTWYDRVYSIADREPYDLHPSIESESEDFWQNAYSKLIVSKVRNETIEAKNHLDFWLTTVLSFSTELNILESTFETCKIKFENQWTSYNERYIKGKKVSPELSAEFVKRIIYKIPDVLFDNYFAIIMRRPLSSAISSKIKDVVSKVDKTGKAEHIISGINLVKTTSDLSIVTESISSMLCKITHKTPTGADVGSEGDRTEIANNTTNTRCTIISGIVLGKFWEHYCDKYHAAGKEPVFDLNGTNVNIIGILEEMNIYKVPVDDTFVFRAVQSGGGTGTDEVFTSIEKKACIDINEYLDEVFADYDLKLPDFMEVLNDCCHIYGKDTGGSFIIVKDPTIFEAEERKQPASLVRGHILPVLEAYQVLKDDKTLRNFIFEASNCQFITSEANKSDFTFSNENLSDKSKRSVTGRHLLGLIAATISSRPVFPESFINKMSRVLRNDLNAKMSGTIRSNLNSYFRIKTEGPGISTHERTLGLGKGIFDKKIASLKEVITRVCKQYETKVNESALLSTLKLINGSFPETSNSLKEISNKNATQVNCYRSPIAGIAISLEFINLLVTRIIDNLIESPVDYNVYELDQKTIKFDQNVIVAGLIKDTETTMGAIKGSNRDIDAKIERGQLEDSDLAPLHLRLQSSSSDIAGLTESNNMLDLTDITVTINNMDRGLGKSNIDRYLEELNDPEKPKVSKKLTQEEEEAEEAAEYLFLKQRMELLEKKREAREKLNRKQMNQLNPEKVFEE